MEYREQEKKGSNIKHTQVIVQEMTSDDLALLEADLEGEDENENENEKPTNTATEPIEADHSAPANTAPLPLDEENEEVKIEDLLPQASPNEAKDSLEQSNYEL